MVHQMKLYADDSKILGIIYSDEDNRTLQDDIDRGIAWSQKWLMKFNIKKCKVMHVAKNNSKRSAYDYKMTDGDGVAHSLVETVLERDLGVLESNDLKWHEQVEADELKS